MHARTQMSWILYFYRWRDMQAQRHLNEDIQTQLTNHIKEETWDTNGSVYICNCGDGCVSIPEAFPTPRPRPMVEYENDIIAATIESHQIRSKSGIWDKMTCTMPKKTMYMMLDTWHGALSPSAWKQSDLFIALYTQAKSGVNFLRNSGIYKIQPCKSIFRKENMQRRCSCSYQCI